MLQLENLSTRELQAYGAGCLVSFCAEKGIYSSEIEDLIKHLIKLLSCTELAEWEAEGSGLDLPGRGDSLPAKLIDDLPTGAASDFQCLLESVVEIGLVDLYGAETVHPLKFAEKSRAILTSKKISPPPLEELFPLRGDQTVHGWGTPSKRNRFEKTEEWCLLKLRQTIEQNPPLGR